MRDLTTEMFHTGIIKRVLNEKKDLEQENAKLKEMVRVLEEACIIYADTEAWDDVDYESPIYRPDLESSVFREGLAYGHAEDALKKVAELRGEE